MATDKKKFPFAGRSFKVDYGRLVLSNEYSADGTKVSYVISQGVGAGLSGEVEFSWKALEAENYLVSWKQHDGTTVVHVDNFEGRYSDAFVTTPDGDFNHDEGKITIVEL